MFLHSGTCTKSLAIVINNTLLLATARTSDLSATGLPGPDIAADLKLLVSLRFTYPYRAEDITSGKCQGHGASRLPVGRL
jgi:hypothetical protein